MVPFWSAIQKNWCYIMHPDPMWPVNGVYRCPKCLNEFPVVWEQDMKRRPKQLMNVDGGTSFGLAQAGTCSPPGCKHLSANS